MSTTHNLKCWPEPFAAVASGIKTFEVRVDDLPYAVGDTLILREWCPDLYKDAIADGSSQEEAMDFAYTGATCAVRVAYCWRGAPLLPPGLVAMAVVRGDADAP